MCGLQSVATIGSTLTSVQHDVKNMQTALESQKKEADETKKAMVNMHPFFQRCKFVIRAFAFGVNAP